MTPLRSIPHAHALIDRRNGGGLLVGELAMVAVLAFQFGVLLLALVRTPREKK